MHSSMAKLLNRSYIFVLWAISFAVYFAVRFNTVHPIWVEALVKAVPELLFIAAVVAHRERLGKKIYVPVLCALVFSILGDTAGEYKVGNMEFIAFVLQIVFFIFAQVSYTICFVNHIDRKAGVTGWTPWGVASAVVIFSYICFVGFKVFSALDDVVLIIACGIYMCSLLGTGFSAAQQKRPYRWIFVVGAMFFIFSDSIIALNTFVTDVPHSGLIIMSTYFVAQFLLNITLVPTRRELYV